MEHHVRSGSTLLSRCLLAACGVALLATAAAGAVRGAPAAARYIWFPEGNPARNAPAENRYFRKRVTLPATARTERARFFMAADDSAQLYVNGQAVGKATDSWKHIVGYNLSRDLKVGENVLAVRVSNSTGPAGLIGWLTVPVGSRRRVLAVTDATWRASKTAPRGWSAANFSDATWPAAKVLGPLGMAPWGRDLRRSGVGLGVDLPRPVDGPLTAVQARRMLEADWLCQADNYPRPSRGLQEIGWARHLADRIARMPGGPSFRKELAELDRLETQLKSLPADEESDAATDLYLAVRRVKRRLMLANPRVNFDRLLVMDTPAYAGKHESAHRNGYYYGSLHQGRLRVLEGLGPDAPARDVIPPDGGYLMRMDLSFDATRVVFAMKPAGIRSFHLYEARIPPSGAPAGAPPEPRQLTNSAYDDMDPIYLPASAGSTGREHMLFSTSRAHTYVRCLPQSASTVLARCDADGRNITILSRNSEPDYTPALLADGRVLYTRWEYTERPLWRLEKLWTIRPDGTGEAVYWGNSSAYPDMLWEARPIPGSHKVMFVAVGHHDVMTGCLGILDVTGGREWPHGIAKVTAEIPWPEVGNDSRANPVASPRYHASGPAWSYRCPWPLGGEDFLVSVARSRDGRFDLFLMDTDGNRELLYAGRHNIWYARPLRPRPAPPVAPDRVAWPKPGEKPQPGVLFSPNVFHNAPGLSRKNVKYLRVIQMDAKTYSMGFKSWRHSGPVISAIQEDGVKRILGTAEIQPDGSVAFRVPAGKALHFELLDEHYRCVQVMRSFTGVMPGEQRGCLGCHSLHSASPDKPTVLQAARHKVAELTPPPWGATESISYLRFCQPILDKYCGRCHQGKGKGRAKLDLTLRGGVAERGITDPALLPFKEPYLTLIGQAWSAPRPAGRGKAVGLAGCLNVEAHRRYGPLAPGTMLSSTSPLIRMVMAGTHNKVKIEGTDLRRLIAWVDTNCVYRGDEEVRQIPDPPANVAARFPVPVKTRTAPTIQRLQAVTDPPARRH